jgi:delta 1-pyrroline-5-carboxylate dehydrogenase
MSDDPFSKALHQQREKAIEKLERDLTFMEAQLKEVEAVGLNEEKAEGLRDGINGVRNALDFLKVVYARELPLQPWEEGRKK